MDVLFGFLKYQTAIVVDSPVPFILALVFGIIIGFGVAWIILRDEIALDRQVIRFYRARFGEPEDDRRVR